MNVDYQYLLQDMQMAISKMSKSLSLRNVQYESKRYRYSISTHLNKINQLFVVDMNFNNKCICIILLQETFACIYGIEDEKFNLDYSYVYKLTQSSEEEMFQYRSSENNEVLLFVDALSLVLKINAGT